MNRLQFETSPYLLQHKNNPVEWFSWDDEAFAKAKAEDKPIFLSIGYSSCHWCHVMERESFENKEIAEYLNENFVSIKVDREERPDVDNIYMNYVQMISGSGGWPLSVFLTPDKLPFFGGTYFPPDDRGNRPGFKKLLTLIYEAYKNQKAEILSKEGEIKNALHNMANLNLKEGTFEFADFEAAYIKIKDTYDQVWGGFGSAPKFPSVSILLYLLRYYHLTKDEAALEMVENSLLQMGAGGMYDQIGGGFSRYSTDERWTFPHFEKMLYDNALLSRLYLETYQATQNAYYLVMAEDIFDFLLRDMKDASGGFYSAIDADSEGVEGKYYIYNYDELKAFLNEEEFNAAVKFYNLHESGNFEGSNIFTARANITEISAELGYTEGELLDLISSVRSKIFADREKRVKPSTDDKILTSWNGLLLSSLSLAYSITGKKRYLDNSSELAEFIWSKCYKNGVLYHSYKNGETKYQGYLDNYSFVAEGFTELYCATFNEEYLQKAGTLMDIAVTRFYDKAAGNFFYTDENSGDLLLRSKDLYDNALPSGNSAAIHSLIKLNVLLDKPEYTEYAKRNISKIKELAIKYPSGFAYALMGALLAFNGLKEIAVVAADDQALNKFTRLYYNEYLPFAVFAAKTNNSATRLTLLHDKKLLHENCTVYVCENYTCKEPVSSIEELKANLIMQ